MLRFLDIEEEEEEIDGDQKLDRMLTEVETNNNSLFHENYEPSSQSSTSTSQL